MAPYYGGYGEMAAWQKMDKLANGLKDIGGKKRILPITP